MGTIDSHRKAAEEAGRKARALEEKARAIDHWSAKLFTFVTDIEVKDESAPVHLSKKEFAVAVAKSVLFNLVGGAVFKVAGKLLKVGGKKAIGLAKKLMGKGGRKAGKGVAKKAAKGVGKGGKGAGGKGKAPPGKGSKPPVKQPPSKSKTFKRETAPPSKGPARTARTNGAKGTPKSQTPPKSPPQTKVPARENFFEPQHGLQDLAPTPAGRSLPWRPNPKAYQLAASTGASDGQDTARRMVAYHFYAETNPGWTDKQIFSHMDGIDFSKPISVGRVADLPVDRLPQHRYPGREGNYFGLQTGLKPTHFGVEGGRLNDAGQYVQRVETMVDPGKASLAPDYLRSSASGVETHWTNPPWKTAGGADQVFIPDVPAGSEPFRDFTYVTHGPSAPPRLPLNR